MPSRSPDVVRSLGPFGKDAWEPNCRFVLALVLFLALAFSGADNLAWQRLRTIRHQFDPVLNREDRSRRGKIFHCASDAYGNGFRSGAGLREQQIRFDAFDRVSRLLIILLIYRFRARKQARTRDIKPSSARARIFSTGGGWRSLCLSFPS